MSTATAETREAAWLTTSGDGLPALLAADGGPWEVLQAFDPVARRAKKKRALYVMSRSLADSRVSNLRIRPQYAITLDLTWTVRTPTPPIAETEQQNLKDAVDLILQRVRGFPGDKTHGGRFLSAGEAGGRPDVSYGDPFQGIEGSGGELYAVISYRADDFEISG